MGFDAGRTLQLTLLSELKINDNARTKRLALVLATLAAFHASAQQPASPLTPQQALGSFHFADPDMMADLVASEPDVVSPVAIAWDADGRLFVAEMLDYPNATNGGRIKMLEDRDGDGRYERATVFAENLPFPNGVLPWNGGVLVTAAPDILFLRDNDGDGRADERRVVLTGFGEGNQQLRVNGLFWGLDNWIYGANGRSDGEVRRPDATRTVSLRGHDFRFRPGTGEFETIAGRSQFGNTRDDWGNRFLSWNTIPIRHEVLPERYLSRNTGPFAVDSLQDLLPPSDDGRVFPLAPAPLVFNTESSSHFNALAGLTIFRGDLLAEKYLGNAFVGESLLNLVHRRILAPDGVTFTARRGEIGTEFLASTDPWFHPVNFATGPDGALYVVDFYRRFVEHPGFVPGNLREQIPWRMGAEHGRVWRIRSRNSSWPPRPAAPHLSGLAGAELVNQLSNPNGWWRDTAQRLLVERQDARAIPALRAVLRNRNRSEPMFRLCALWTLDGLGGLDDSLLLLLLGDREAAVREHAVRLTERRLNGSAKVSRKLHGLKDDPNVRVRFQTALSLGEWASDARLGALAEFVQRDLANDWISSAVLTSVGNRPGMFLKRLVQADAHWLRDCSSQQARLLERLGCMAGAEHEETELATCLDLVAQAPFGSYGQLAFLAGLADGLGRSSPSFAQLIRATSAANEAKGQSLARVSETVAAVASSSAEPEPRRLLAIRILAHLEPEFAGEVLLDLAQPQQPEKIQLAAADALVGFGDRKLAGELFAGWKSYSLGTRHRLAAAAPRTVAAVSALVQALEAGIVTPDEIDPSTQAALRNSPDPELARRIKKFITAATSGGREEVVRTFQPCLKLAGDGQRGAATFVKLCLQCHAIEGKGNRVGPELAGVATRPREALLVDILDPSRQVTPDFVSYTVTTKQGETLTGLIAAESGNSVTLRRAGQPDETIPRTQIAGLRAEGKSLMPDGLEQGLTQQDLADLLEFLQKPHSNLLPEVK